MSNQLDFESWATKYPPSTIFQAIEQTARALEEDDEPAAADELSEEEVRAGCEDVLQLLERAATFDAEKLMHRSPAQESEEKRKRPLSRYRETVIKLTAIREAVEVGAFEVVLEEHAPELLPRFRAASEPGLKGLTIIRSLIHARLMNRIGELKNETFESRLDRSITLAREEPSVYLGSFAKYASDE